MHPLSVGMSFSLHPKLGQRSHLIGQLDGCVLLLKDHAHFPWMILVPEVADGIEDLHQLDDERYLEVCQAIRKISFFLTNFFKPEKLNVACIGNQVRQMHIHLVARNCDDPAWPGTVWAHSDWQPRDPQEIEAIVNAARAALIDAR
ncbi:MAG: HIT family protein [Verrucomicrobia bacterium]|nr:MAG: HIT family protein [Verrucomicrobiota bacterium]